MHPHPTRRDRAPPIAEIAGKCHAGPFENNHAKRQIRPAVILRKNILCNRSPSGADTQAVLMSIFRTLRLRPHDPTKTIASALRDLLQTGTLPPLPVETVCRRVKGYLFPSL